MVKVLVGNRSKGSRTNLRDLGNPRVYVVPTLFSDLPFEEELLRNPHSLKSWLRYIESREESGPKVLNLLYERALKELPGSYKLWNKYLTIRREQVNTFGFISVPRREREREMCHRLFKRGHNTRRYDIQDNDIRHNDIQRNTQSRNMHGNAILETK